MKITDDFTLNGIALGTLFVVIGYHLARAVAQPTYDGAIIAVGHTGAHEADEVDGHKDG